MVAGRHIYDYTTPDDVSAITSIIEPIIMFNNFNNITSHQYNQKPTKRDPETDSLNTWFSGEDFKVSHLGLNADMPFAKLKYYLI